MDLKNRPSQAKKISSLISEKLKEKQENKEGLNLESLAKDLAKRRIEQENEAV